MSAPFTADDERFMRLALAQALDAERRQEVPVGAVIVKDDEVIGEGANQPVSTHDPTAHAEMQALRAAAETVGNYRLPGTTLYVTLEPCTMCAGALVVARISRLVFGTRDLRFGAVRSKFRLADSDLLNHQVKVEEGLLAEECMQPLKRFFQERR
jgi:tRNA(adenine34) deaminase